MLFTGNFLVRSIRPVFAATGRTLLPLGTHKYPTQYRDRILQPAGTVFYHRGDLCALFHQRRILLLCGSTRSRRESGWKAHLSVPASTG